MKRQKLVVQTAIIPIVNLISLTKQNYSIQKWVSQNQLFEIITSLELSFNQENLRSSWNRGIEKN